MARDDDQSMEFTGRIVRFVLGVILGSITGFTLWAFWLITAHNGWLIIPVAALAIGLLGSVLDDEGWEKLIRALQFWP